MRDAPFYGSAILTLLDHERDDMDKKLVSMVEPGDWIKVSGLIMQVQSVSKLGQGFVRLRGEGVRLTEPYESIQLRHDSLIDVL